MSRPDFLPSTDLSLNAWALNFSGLITLTPTAYGLTAADATALGLLQVDFDNKLALATDPATRTKVTITQKNVSRTALKSAVRGYARRINANPNTTDGQRAELGLNIPDAGPSPIPAPTTRPVLEIALSAPLEHTLRIRDEATPDSRARAAGAIGCEIYVYRGEAPPASLADYAYVELQTRNKAPLDHPEAAKGKQAYVIARWMNERGERGPWSLPVSASIAA